MNRPVIVAPWGSHEKAIVASTYGAEEVYIGVPFTSLRMRQNKVYDFNKLKNTVDALHQNGSKALLTMNIFPRNQDIRVFEAITEQIADVKADAIIFSDPGTYTIIKKYFPNTPMHLSTQTTSLNYESIRFWYELGVKRIVLARELNIKEIKEIKEKVPWVELEVFVHGAVCMTYSGRCLLGDYMAGRPWNKGECNHACRFKYKVWLEEEKRPGKLFQLEESEAGTHILSSKDLCAIHRLQEILPYVDALKIEGRSKSEFYVGSLVKAYKHVRDSIVNGTPINPEIENLVNIIPHRVYWDGFLFNNLKKDFPDPEAPKEEWKKFESEKSPKWQEVSYSWGGRDLDTHLRGYDKNEQLIDKDTDTDYSISYDNPGPIFSRNYFGTFRPEYLEKDGKKYYEIKPKENIKIGMKLNYLGPEHMWEITILDIIDGDKNWLDGVTCNTQKCFIHCDIDTANREHLYRNPQ